MNLKKVQFSKYLPIALIYFFFNSLFLPLGLMYTTLLTPLFIFWLYKDDSLKHIWPFFIVTVPFLIIHIWNGVDLFVYFKSYLLLFSVYIFCLFFYKFLQRINSLDLLFRNIAWLNIFFVILALLLLMSPYYDLMWYVNEISPGAGQTYRLKLLTYEPSYYSLLLIPIVLYYYIRMILKPFHNQLLAFFIVTVPLILSLSFGVIIGLLFTLLLLFFSNPRLFSVKPKLRTVLISGFVLLACIIFALLWFYPNNAISVRFENIFNGNDPSFKGRTSESFYLGWKLAEQKSLLFGTGPGQIKVIGVELFDNFYQIKHTPDQIIIPNNLGDILAKYGLLGVLLKLFLELYFFFKTHVYSNFFRAGLFIFIFIYQFTGSFSTNIAEYVIWVLAFSPMIFREFDKKNVLPLENEINKFNNQGNLLKI